MTTDDREGCVFSAADLEKLREFEDSIPAMGTCYDLDDARRALRDRPSLEAELVELRAKYAGAVVVKTGPSEFVTLTEGPLRDLIAERDRLREELEGVAEELEAANTALYEMGEQRIAVADERDRLREENERLRGALREIVEMRRKTVDVTCQSDCRAGYEWCQMTARAALEAKEKE